MSALVFRQVVKTFGGLRPLRIADLTVEPGERVALSGLDAAAAEMFVNLATGAALPDTGDVIVMDQPTGAIVDGDRWLESLDRFGIVSHRAVLLDGMSVAENIALSFSLSIDPIPPAIRREVELLADAVGIAATDRDRAAGVVSAASQMRVHLARALALNPAVVLLEHPTLRVDAGDVAALAASIVSATEPRGLALLALTDDDTLATGLHGRRLRLNAATGALAPAKRGWFR